MEFSVKDGVRTRKFEGHLLANSSSQVPGKPRWVEFDIYQTAAGSYVISRIGFSVFYHAKDCKTVARNNLSPVDGLVLSGDYIPCYTCKPNRAAEEGVFPETPRAAAWVCPDAQAVVASLMREDNNGTEYLTKVALRLLVEASELDDDIADAFYVDHIE